MKTRTKVLSVTAGDCRWDYYRGSGAGGQHRNKTSNCARCTHPPSGAVGIGEEGRSLEANRKTAWRKMAASQEFQRWLSNEIVRRAGGVTVEQVVEKQLLEETLVQEEVDGKWVAAPRLAISPDDLEDM